MQVALTFTSLRYSRFTQKFEVKAARRIWCATYGPARRSGLRRRWVSGNQNFKKNKNSEQAWLEQRRRIVMKSTESAPKRKWGEVMAAASCASRTNQNAEVKDYLNKLKRRRQTEHLDAQLINQLQHGKEARLTPKLIARIKDLKSQKKLYDATSARQSVAKTPLRVDLRRKRVFITPGIACDRALLKSRGATIVSRIPLADVFVVADPAKPPGLLDWYVRLRGGALLSPEHLTEDGPAMQLAAATASGPRSVWMSSSFRRSLPVWKI